MSTVVTYANNERQCFCQIKFDSGERVLISMTGTPKPSVKVMRLALAGLIPTSIIWEAGMMTGENPRTYAQRLMGIFPPQEGGAIHPLDVIRDALLGCSSIEDARRKLAERQQRVSS